MKPAVLRWLPLISATVSIAQSGEGGRAVAVPPHSLIASDTIRSVFLHGNRRTRPEIVHHYLQIDTGRTYDTVTASAARERLMRSGLFGKVELLQVRKAQGVDLHVVMTEKMYLAITDIGGDIFDKKYGRPEWWWRGRGGITYGNFRGRNERISVAAGIWESRYLSLGWSKRFPGTPYFLGLSSSIRSNPEIHHPIRTMSIAEMIAFGKNLDGTTSIQGALIATHGKRMYFGPPGLFSYKGLPFGTDTTAGTVPSQDYDTTWTDTVGIGDSVFQRTWTGLKRDSIEKTEEGIPEVNLKLGWYRDLRDTAYDPRNGWYFGYSTLTNALLPRSDDPAYLQVDADIRHYRPGISPNHTVAAQGRITLRADTGGVLQGLYTGGTQQVRGYASGEIGLPETSAHRYRIPNNRIMGSIEYRTRLWESPRIDMRQLEQLESGLRGFFYRIDAALFTDAAVVWHRMIPLEPEGNRYGIGSGFGLRMTAPTIGRSVCADFAWGLVRSDEVWRSWSDRSRAAASKERTAVGAWFVRNRPLLPEAHIYLDMPF